MPRLAFLYRFALVATLLAAALPAKAEITPPVSSYTKAPSAPNGENGWFITPVVFDISATDLESGVREINYRVDSGTWQTVSFPDSLNLAPNPSFEEAGGGAASILDWDAPLVDEYTVFSQDPATYAPGFGTASAKIATTGTGWHSLNHSDNFAVSTSYSNMSSSIWLKTDSTASGAYFKIYAISSDGLGGQLITLIGASPKLFGTQGWTQISYDFVVSVPNALGVYMDIGLDGPGTVWADAATIKETTISATTQITIGSDNENHRLEFYSKDWANNTESYSCTTPVKNCVNFKLDQTPPGNWHDSGAFRGLLGAAYQLWVYTTVEDETSGLSVFTDKYNIKTELHPDWGRYSNILSCSSTWQPNQWVILISPPFTPGVDSAYLLTPKTSFCNSNWNRCKYVKFFSKDMAGNSATKEYCINGPWIKLRGGGIVRAAAGINMISEADGDNTDSLIGSTNDVVEFFTSTRNWETLNTTVPEALTYEGYWDTVQSKTELGSTLGTQSGVFFTSGDLTIDAAKLGSGFSTATFSKVIFVNGTLTVNTNIDIYRDSTLLFIVKEDVKVAKTTTTFDAAAIVDNDFYSAYDLIEGDSTPTLNLNGIYSANKFIFDRTLQGTDNSNIPSENFVYEPKYIIKLRDYIGKKKVQWQSVE